MRTHSMLILLLFLSLCMGGCGQNPAVSPTAASGPDLPQPTSPEIPPTEIASNPTGDPVRISSAHFWDAENGWGIGAVAEDAFQHVLRTSDAGNTWVDVTPVGAVADPLVAETAALPAFVDANHAYVLYHAPTPTPPAQGYRVWYTADGGVNWQASQPLPLPETLEFFLPSQMGFSDAANGWLMVHLGAGMSHDYVALYKTADSGQTWQSVVDPSQDGVIKNSLPMTCSKNGVIFQDAMTGWVSGGCNGVLPGLFLYETTDGGITWLPVALPSPPTAPNLLMDDQNVCDTHQPDFHSGLTSLQVSCRLGNGASQTWLYTSTDSGQNWQVNILPAAFGSVDFVPGGPVWLLGSDSAQTDLPGDLFRSEDGGVTWHTLMSDLNWQGELMFLDRQNGFGIVTAGESPRLIKTNDGGQTWVEVNPLLKPNS